MATVEDLLLLVLVAGRKFGAKGGPVKHTFVWLTRVCSFLDDECAPATFFLFLVRSS